MPTKDENTDLGFAIIHIMLFPFLLSVNICLDSLAARKLWQWFIMPEFSVSELTWAAAIGIGFLATLWTQQSQAPSNRRPHEMLSAHIGHAIFNPLTLLAVGWIAKSILKAMD